MGCGGRAERPPAADAGRPEPAPAPPWTGRPVWGKLALSVEDTVAPLGADQLLPRPSENAVYAFKRSFRASVIYRIELGNPAAPELAGELRLPGRISEFREAAGYLCGAVQDDRATEILALRPGRDLRIAKRLRIAPRRLGPAAAGIDVLYLAEELPEEAEAASRAGGPTPPRAVLTFAIVRGPHGSVSIAPRPEVVAPGRVLSLATDGARLVAAVWGEASISVFPIDEGGALLPRPSSLSYRVVKRLPRGEYAMPGRPLQLLLRRPGLLLASDINAQLVSLRVDRAGVPSLVAEPEFDHRAAGGVLAMDGDRLLVGKGVRVIEYGFAGAETRIAARTRLLIGGRIRDLATAPGLLLCLDDTFGVYTFRR